MPINIDIDLSLLKDSLLINLNRSISTLESNYYINKVCIAYSKLLCLEGICSALLQCERLVYTINAYEVDRLKSFIDTPDYLGNEFDIYSKAAIYCDFAFSKTYDLSDYREAKIFFKLFDAFELPFVYMKKASELGRFSLATLESIAHDMYKSALKILLVRHFSPPEYFVKALDYIIDYLITDKREEELKKINVCIQHQEYLYKDMAIVEKVVSISKVLSDENVDHRIKIYVLNSLRMILEEQEKLHKKMGITPTITHVDLLT